MQTSDISTATRADIAPTPQKSTDANSSSDFKTFLTLLTAQMRNQDPLKPMDSTEFVAQLASFSSVEQQVETNSKLGELLAKFTNNPANGLSEWLGKEVRREGSTEFDGRPVDINVDIQPSADSARLVVRDENAAIIYSQQLDPNAEVAKWDGSSQGNEVAPAGRYSFAVESYADGTLLETNPGSVFDLVTEVRLDAGNTLLIFKDGTALQAEDASAVRMPQS